MRSSSMPVVTLFVASSPHNNMLDSQSPLVLCWANVPREEKTEKIAVRKNFTICTVRRSDSTHCFTGTLRVVNRGQTGSSELASV